MRVIVYTGKGGVGKTSLAAATAIGSARRGHRTLVLSTDTAHSLGDSFDIELSGKPKRLAQDLWAMEVNVIYEMESKYRKFLDYWAEVNESRGYNKVLASELAIFPSMEELVNMTVVGHYAGDYDVVIVDSGPTADSIRNLSFFGSLGGVLKQYARVERVAARTLRPFKGELWGYPIPEDAFYRIWLALLDQSEAIDTMLKNPRVTSLRPVVNPEKMVIDESRRAFLYFNLLGLNTDAIILNKILPAEVTGAQYREWKREHKAYVQLVESSFGGIPLFKADLQRDEVVGTRRLEDLCKQLFGDEDPASLFSKDKPIRFFKRGDRYLMAIKFPFVEAGEVRVLRKGDSLLIRVGKFERSFELPWVLRELSVERASLQDGFLEVTFEGALSNT